MSTLARVGSKVFVSVAWLLVAAVPLGIAGLLFVVAMGSSLHDGGDTRHLEILIKGLLLTSFDLVIALVVFLIVDLFSMRKKSKGLVLAVAFFVLAIPPIQQFARIGTNESVRPTFDGAAVEANALAAAAADRLPVNPFESVQPGDWTALASVGDEDESASLYEVTKVEGDRVTVRVRTSSEFRVNESSATFSRKEAPRWTSFFPNLMSSPRELFAAVSSSSVSDVSFEVGATRVAGRTLSIEGTMGSLSGVGLEVTVSASRDVKGVGLVRFSALPSAYEAPVKLALVGHGTAAGASWGRRPPVFASAPSERLNPFEAAAPGDWSAIAYEGSGGRSLTTYEVEKIDSGRVTLRIRSQDATGKTVRAMSLTLGAARAPDPWSFSQDYLSNLSVSPGRVVAEEATRSVGGRTFACQKLSAYTEDGPKLELWLSKDVKGAGIVADVATRLPTWTGVRGSERGELVGYGTRDQVLWGTRPK